MKRAFLIGIMSCGIGFPALVFAAATDPGAGAPQASVAPSASVRSSDEGSQTQRPVVMQTRWKDLPLPGNATMPQEAQELWLGSSRLEVLAFTSRLSMHDLREFYVQGLQQDGWQIQSLPWQARNAEMLTQFQSWLLTETDPIERQRLSHSIQSYDEAQTFMTKAVYATRGEERVIVNLEPQSKGSLAYLYQWHAPLKGKEPEAALPTWLQRNVLCGGDSVPGQEREWALFVPAYPAARTVAKTIGQQSSDVSLLALTADTIEAAKRSYERRLTREGWQRITAEDDRVYGLDSNAGPMVFRRGETRCVVFLSPLSAEAQSSGFRTLMAVLTVNPSPYLIQIERTHGK